MDIVVDGMGFNDHFARRQFSVEVRQTLAAFLQMSALPPIADIESQSRRGAVRGGF
jgi:hypothetical protein